MRSQDEVAAMQCPVCRVPLAMSDRQGIEIDYCPQCRGVWLDRGELDKIIERSAPQLAPTPPEPPRAPQPPQPPQPPQGGYGRDPWGREQHHQPHGGGYGYGKPYKKRKKSFLEEIFD